MNHEGHRLPDPPEETFKASVMVRMSVGEDHCPELPGVDPEYVHVVARPISTETGVVQDPVGGSITMDCHCQ